MRRLTAAETLLLSLGVDDPKEIDLEAIAWCLGAEVRYAPLESCEARIIGFGGRAIITVDNRHRPTRIRFSIGHELGHWHFHRGKSSICRSDEIGSQARSLTHPERVADAFAADLLMPPYLFEPAAQKLKRSTFATVDALASLFRTSRSATALRVVDFGPEPSILICHGVAGRKWFKRGPDVPDRWFPRDELDAQSNAFEALHGNVDRPQPMLIGADAWFDRRGAEDHEVYEHTVRTPSGEVLTLLTFKGLGMLS
ncbi:ImmA/IrrE family metallo-endopeptidase [Phenylobacterium sp.]|uniref:ImmA/IrrE family metallo-endopeptidase n=1 Tax=Phenylobacterium sp. TaxID=1871053 RepID=UPI003BA9E703